ncbi:glutathione S-transferase 1-like [Anopheles aquasalis]|uniref:glutathione S-transferase 1-like n=1 Tax=Anopheles aquasalis TaxID=42839 RepID=UPI00215A122D|nr:glutathione S-transferase 1-like [Anopheles aquasalis]
MCYLVEKYGAQHETLYPRDDPQRRALINQRLYFDMGTLYQRFGDYYYPQIFEGAPANEENYGKIGEALAFLELFLTGNDGAAQYVAGGDCLSLADISIYATLTTFEVAGYDLAGYSNISAWYKRMGGSIPGAATNRTWAEAARPFFEKVKH